MLLGRTPRAGERLQLVHQALGMDPTQSMLANVELSGIVTDHDGVADEPVCIYRAPQGAFGGGAHRIGSRSEPMPRKAVSRLGGHCRTGKAEPLKMARPGFLIGKLALLMRGQSLHQRSGQGMITHVVQRRVVTYIAGVIRPQQVEKVQPALAGSGAESGEGVVADLRADGVGTAVTGTGLVHADPLRCLQSSTQCRAGLVRERVLPADQQAHHLPLADGGADSLQRHDNPFGGDLALGVPHQDLAAQLWPK
jgi:hypothetical protein